MINNIANWVRSFFKKKYLKARYKRFGVVIHEPDQWLRNETIYGAEVVKMTPREFKKLKDIKDIKDIRDIKQFNGEYRCER